MFKTSNIIVRNLLAVLFTLLAAAHFLYRHTKTSTVPRSVFGSPCP